MTHSDACSLIFCTSTRALLSVRILRTRAPPGPMINPSIPVHSTRSTAPPNPSTMTCFTCLDAAATASGYPLTTHSSMRWSTWIFAPVSDSIRETVVPRLPMTRPTASALRHGMISSIHSPRSRLPPSLSSPQSPS
eukprot:5684-Pelagococcus_subviridis.AAC.4